MCEQCSCESSGKQFQYVCDCKKEACDCSQIIEFDEEPKATPYCCGMPMKKIK